MFDFIQEIDRKEGTDLSDLLSDIHKNIKEDTTAIPTVMQTYLEKLLKTFNSKACVPIDYSGRITLGVLLRDDDFLRFLKSKAILNIRDLQSINSRANDKKHEYSAKLNLNEKEKYYRTIHTVSVSVYNYICNKTIKDPFDDNFFSELLITSEEEKQQIIDDFNKDREHLIAEKRKEIELERKKHENLLAKKDEEIKAAEAMFKELTEKLKNTQSNLAELKSSHTYTAIEKDKAIKELEHTCAVLQKDVAKENNRAKQIEEKYKRREKEYLEQIKKNEKLIINHSSQSQGGFNYARIRRGLFSWPYRNSYLKDDSNFIVKNVAIGRSISQYESFYAVVNNLLQRGSYVSKSDYLTQLHLSDSSYKEIIKLQMAVLLLIKNGKLGDNEFEINYIGGDVETLSYAIEDILLMVEDLSLLAKKPFNRPVFKLSSGSKKVGAVNIKYDNLLNTDREIVAIEDLFSDGANSKSGTLNLWIADSIRYSVTGDDEKILLKFLSLFFGFKNFNSGQYDILRHTLNGYNTAGVLPTGGGKSLIYQLAALLQPKMTIVIAPLNSLIKDQIRSLNEKYNIDVCGQLIADNANKSADEDNLRAKRLMFVFCSPERFQIVKFRDLLLGLNDKEAFDTVVLDEVHCLSEWGHEFRVSYLMLAQTLNTYFENIKFLGLTATAAAFVIKDLQIELNLEDDDIIFQKNLRRTNLTFEFNDFASETEMKEYLIDEIGKTDVNLRGPDTNATVIFSKTIKKVELLKTDLSTIYKEEVDCFHSKYKESQEGFMNNKKSLLVATKAFGMGIDKPNIRMTYHYGLPSSLEAFYQEAGRAGRDGKPGICKMLSYQIDSRYKPEVDRFMDLNTSINEMKLISGRLKEKTDLSINFFFLIKELDLPSNEAINCVNIAKNLEVSEDKNTLIKVDKDNAERDMFEKDLYMLHKIGVVEDWGKEYGTDFSVRFFISLNKDYRSKDHIRMKAVAYIAHYGGGDEFIDAIHEISEEDYFAFLYAVILNIREWYHKTFVTAQREKLLNVYNRFNQYKDVDASNEIQEYIEAYFDLSKVIDRSLFFEGSSTEAVFDMLTGEVFPNIKKRIIEMERILESTTNKHIDLYLSLLNLKNNSFRERNGKERFVHILKIESSQFNNDVYLMIASKLYPTLSSSQKQEIMETLYYNDEDLFKKVFLENVLIDKDAIMYYTPYLNKSLKSVMGGL